MPDVIISPTGVQGPRGNSVLSGTGIPTSGTGIDGDYYIDDTHYPTSVILYGPKTAGAWPGSGLTLAGAAGALLAANNLSDLLSASTARTNLGLGGAALLSVGTTTGTVAAGDDSRIAGAAQKSANLSDLGSAATARTNLAVPPSSRQVIAGTGLTGGGDLTADRTFTVTYGATAGTAAQGNDARFVAAATTVVTETGYGQASTVGVDTTYAREDHTHGSPALTSSAPAVTEGIGQAAAVGSATTPARADHVHPLAAAGAPAASAVASTQVTGVASTFAASDHVHAREGFGAVTAQTTFGASSANGSATTVAHSDHAHGTPTLTRTWAGLLTPTGVKVANYSAVAGDFVPVDTTSGAITVTLPTAPADLTVVAVKMIATATAPNAVNVVTGGSDVYNKTGGATSLALSLPSQAVQVQYSAGPAIWYVLDDDLPLGQLDARYQRVVTVATATGVSATDAASIGAAITAAGTGGTIYFPQGTYVADSLAPLSGQTWYGPATIQRPASSTNSVITATGITGFTMRELTVDGNRASSTATSNAAIYLINTTGTQLVGLTVQNTPSANAGIILRGAVRCIVDACQLTTVGYGVLIGLNHGDAYACNSNVIRNCMIDTTDADAIFLSENLGSTTSISVVGSVIGTVVSGCTVRNFGDCGIEIGSGTLHTEVSGCTFIGISNGAGNNGILFRDAAHGNVTGCTVSNLTKTGSTGVYMVNLNGSNQHNSVNNVDCYNVGYGYIVVGGTSGGSVGTPAVDIAFNGGVIDTTAIDGIHLNNVQGFSITGTQVHNAGQQGISVGKFSTSSATDGTITGARVFNSSQQTTGDSGIILFQSSADILITGCRIGDNQGGSKTQAYGIRIFDTTVSNVTISNTDLTNGGTTSNFTSAPAAGSGIQVLNCIGVSPSALPNVTTQPGAAAEPSDHGLIAWSYDAGLASQSSTTVSGGTLYLTAVYPRTAFNSTKVYFSVATVGVTPTAGDNWIGLYNQSGILLASKGIDSNVTAGVGLQTITWTTATGTQPAGQYWIGFFFNAGTEPTLYRAPTPADNATQNVGLTTTNYRMCQQAGGFTTALPSPLTVASNSISSSPRLFWVALG